MNSSNEKVKFLLNWNRFSDHLSTCMTRLMTDGSYSDVIIATSDKHMIYAHRFILANSSKYFQRLLKQMNKQKGVQLVVALPEIKYEIFKILMNYMYKGETQVPHELLPSVIKAGQILEINGLIDLKEGENSTNGASLVKFNMPDRLNQPKQIERKASEQISILHEKLQQRKAKPFLPRYLLQPKKKRCQNLDIDSTSETVIVEENLKKAKSKEVVHTEKKEVVQITAKRKASKDHEKEIPSSSTENPLPKKRIIKPIAPEEPPAVVVKDEKEDSWEEPQVQDVEEEITIKTEVPDQEEEEEEEEEASYNELQCEYCHQGYANPSDWVRHMTEHHGDRGYQTYKDMEKDVGADAVYTCVICSSVLFSAADWARHLKIWHTDKELAVANTLAASRKSDTNGKKRPE